MSAGGENRAKQMGFHHMKDTRLHMGNLEQEILARDLHDDLGQYLLAARCRLALLQQHLEATGSPGVRDVVQIGHMLNEASKEVRQLTRGILPVSPDKHGLMSALRGLAAWAKGAFQIDCRFDCRHPVAIKSQETGTHLFRIAREALTNALKHGRAKRIRIRLMDSHEKLVLCVTDNGVGFKQARSSHGGLGLESMKLRARLMGGSLHLRRLPAGTEVKCTVEKPFGRTVHCVR
jgi:signal transduction histidine kinase